jgi:prepilin-type N-terminal cleavage/methylation domain-containing protein
MSVQCEILVSESKQQRKNAHCDNTLIYRQRGIGMIEVMIVMVVIGIVLLGFAQFTAGGISAAGFSANRAEAMRLAQQILNQARIKNFAKSDTDTILGTRAKFFRTWVVTKLEGQPSKYHLDVTVSWNEADASEQKVNIVTDLFPQSAAEAAKLLYAKMPGTLNGPSTAPGTLTPPIADATPPETADTPANVPDNLAGAITINGTINASGSADPLLVGVMPEDGEKDVTCQTAAGTFICKVPFGWTGRLRVASTQPGAGVSPASMSYSDVKTPVYSQDIMAVKIK